MDEELIGWAYPYAIDALDLDERRTVDVLLAGTDDTTRAEFEAQVRLTAETMADLSTLDALEPPPALRNRILDAVALTPQTPELAPPVSLAAERRKRRSPWGMALAAAAAAVIVVSGIGIGVQASDNTPSPNTVSEIMAAPDVRTTTLDIPGGGTATTAFSPSEDAAVLTMNNVTPPSADKVYQMWLVAPDGVTMTPAGTMAPGDVKPATQVVLDGVGTNTRLAFTVEPAGGSTTPTDDPFAIIPLI
ncbi:anti-sigma factor [Rhodococcus sp. IEGM 1379]|uniref:anti-sigma factor n=1 Tax=Rhodococcus sp. IEGM 1379 TaxID=3047086 RepID=UPI0024B7DEFB|nr:anti-sigma factor [Rhodococcus sp. IEGM 1379]MDI9918174.1 anti-sigma factor [Rhodococcus sp. IEGM 1379]